MIDQTTPISLEDLPPVRGQLRAQSRLAKITWFQVGGPADIIFKPKDLEDLQAFLKSCPPSLAVYPIGVGSNLLVRDGGLNAVVVRLGRNFTNLSLAEDGSILAGAANLDMTLAKFAAQHTRTGLEFYAGIPGTIGGALRMNAGAYGRETKDCLIEATLVTRSGELKTLKQAELDFGYRHCGIPQDWIFVAGRFASQSGKQDEIAARMQEIQTKRGASQPIRARTGGSTFRNPPGYSAWQLVDQAGMRGATVGRAQISELHSNFLINQGGATATDLEKLGEQARAAVKAKSGIDLIWEIKRIGNHPAETPAETPLKPQQASLPQNGDKYG